MDPKDLSAEVLHTELRGILDDLVQSVNRQASATVEAALEPSKESHAQLKDAASSAAVCIRDARQLVTTLREASDSLRRLTQSTVETRDQLAKAGAELQQRLAQQEQAFAERWQKVEAAVGRWSTRLTLALVATILVFAAVMLRLLS